MDKGKFPLKYIFILHHFVDYLAKTIIQETYHGAHWCLAVADFMEQEPRYYDSMLGEDLKSLNYCK